MTEPLLTAREVAETFGFSGPGWVLEKTRVDVDPLPCYRLGATHGPVRFRASQVEEWLTKRSSMRAAS